ncbi:MAG: DUF2339 domain-containing protein, partial [Verrucomicrobiales bacterium]
MEELFILFFILLVIYVLVTPAIALSRSVRSRRDAEEALRKAEEAFRKAEEALQILRSVDPALPGEPAVPVKIAEVTLPQVEETLEEAGQGIATALPSRIIYAQSLAFTLWVRDRKQLSLSWTELAAVQKDEVPVIPEGKLVAEDSGEKALPVVLGAPLKDSRKQVPVEVGTSEVKPATGEPVKREAEVVKPASESIEMQLGTYWFVRIGVMLLLTGAGILAFYKRDFFFDLSPAVKVGGLYLLSGLLAGVGFWLQRTRDTLRNYGQVLIAGGFSGVYFITYAAHIFEPVKVITDPTVALLLLLAWGGFMAWAANRLRSETVALFAVGASYYATYVPLIHVDSGGVSHWVILASNVILAIVAVAFMLRNRWVKMPLLSMSAAYAGFVLWRVRVEDPAPLAIVLLFAASLWIIYSAAVFLSRHDDFNDHKRAAFLTANNAALFGFLTWDVLRDHSHQFWILPLSLGVVLLVGALAARRLLGDQPLSCKSFLTQGLTLVTLGLMTTQLSESIKGPILAAESVVLLFMAIRRDNKILEFAALAAGVIAICFGIYDINVGNPDYLIGCLSIMAFLLFGGWLCHRRLEGKSEAILRPRVSFFSVLGIGIGLLAFLSASQAGDTLPVILVGATLLFTASFYLLRVREFVLIGQVPALAGLCYSWLFIAEGKSLTLSLLLVMIATLGLAHWWRWQRDCLTKEWVNRKTARMVPLCAEGIFSAGLIIQLLSWLCLGRELQQQWLWLGPLLALALMGYGALTRAAFLTALGQVFLFIGCFWSLSVFLPHIYGDVDGGEVPMLSTLAPIGGLLLTSPAIIAALRIEQVGAVVVRLIAGLQVCYRWAAAALGMLWIHHFIPDAYRVLFAFGVAVLFLLGCFLGSKGVKGQWQGAALAYALVGGLFLVMQFAQQQAFWQSLVVIVTVLILQLWMRIRDKQFEVADWMHNALIATGGAALFLWVTIRVSGMEGDGIEGLLSLSWSGLGLLFFVLGLMFRERWHGTMGLVILGITLLSMLPQFAQQHALWQSLAAIVIVLGVQRSARIMGERFHVADGVHKAIIAAAGAALFLWVTTRVSGMKGEGIEGLRSISWSGLGLLFFVLGLTLKERWYRLMGLTVLGITLLSLVPIIWGFSTEWKIASFFVLGLVFVVLGFVYNRYR